MTFEALCILVVVDDGGDDDGGGGDGGGGGDVNWRAVKRAQITATITPINLTMEDNKRPDGTTLLRWAKDKPLAWDVTIPDTYAYTSHIVST